jgi:hypothetical protein
MLRSIEFRESPYEWIFSKANRNKGVIKIKGKEILMKEKATKD